MLAELIVPIVGASPGTWTVADRPDVRVEEERRPFVVHLRMLQEWLWCGPTCCDALSSPPTSGVIPPRLTGPGVIPPRPEVVSNFDFVNTPSGLPPYSIVAAGVVGRDERRLTFNNLRAKRLDDGTFFLTFDGYQLPSPALQYVVKALPVSAEITNQLSVTFVAFRDDGFVLRLNVAGRVAAGLLDAVELMVEVSEATAGGE
jgi:hypothetical protein